MMQLLVLLSESDREKHGVEDRGLLLDLDAVLKRPFGDVVALEDEMDGGLSLARLRLSLHEYSARHLRGIAYLALREAGKAPKWADFQPDLAGCQYYLAGDVDPPGQGSGDSSQKAPARTSSKSARTSRSSTGSRRTR